MRRGAACRVTVALLGAPNTGKTTLFNALTGRASRVTNWPGTTVDVEVAEILHRGTRICLVDLPGTYGLSGSGPEEKFTRDFIVGRRPDALIVVVDSTNLPRSLYLALEALEYHPRVIVALSKIDEARRRGIRIDFGRLSKLLGAPVIPVSGLKGWGLDELLDAVVEGRGGGGRVIVDYGPLRECIESVSSRIRGWPGGVAPEVVALKLLEGVEWARRLCGEGCREALEEAEECRRRLLGMGVDPAAAAVSARYAAAERIASEAVSEQAAWRPVVGVIDRLLVNPYTGPPAALAILFTLFLAVFTLNTGFPLNIVAELLGARGVAEALEKYSLAGLLASLFDWLASCIKGLLGGGLLAGLLADGVVAGVGLIVSFVPLIFMVFLLLGLLEDSGLLPRIAVGLDHVFRLFGVSGKAVFPALISLGCNVPGVMAARIMDTREERVAVILATPFMPCQARLIVVLALASAAAATAAGQAALVLEAYMIAIGVYLATIFWVRRLALRGEAGPGGLVIEQPPLKRPSLRIAWWHAWSGLKHFLVRAGTVILAMSVVLWLLTHYGPAGPAATPADSYAAALGHVIAPVIEVVWGVGPEKAWRVALALISGLAAKEVLLEALVMAAPVAATASLRQALAWYGFTPQQWLGIMVASILYIPCAATIATIYAETRSWKLTLLSIVYSLALATLAGGLVYRVAAP